MNAPVVAALGLTLAAALVGCSEADLPQRSLRRDDCLRDVSLQGLPQALRRCDQVVARFPNDPGPRNERSVLLALAGDDRAACRDIETAMTLVRQKQAKRLDPLLVSEVNTRYQSCREAS